MRSPLILIVLCVLLCATSVQLIAQQPLGLFSASTDVGNVLHRGEAVYDSAAQTYTLTGSGTNIWIPPDEFQFVWKKVTGDYAITADVDIVTSDGNPHRKAVLMIRQSLDPDSVYADIALHGEGLTSLQFRDEKGGATHEVQSSLRAPKRMRLVRRGDYLYMLLAHDDEPLQVAAGSPRILISGDYYIGIGVCSHDKDAATRVKFSNVALDDRSSQSTSEPVMFSVLETITVNSADRKAAYVTSDHIEAPNWTHDGTAFLFNSGGHMYRLPIGGAKPELIDTGSANRCNNDHGISPGAKTLVISDQTLAPHDSLIYTLPINGGTPKRITQNAPSYWHGWSPDGRTLAFVGQRDIGQGNKDFDIYTIPVDGGAETRLTTAKGLDDGPEYTPDGRFIYFNSERTGHMQIWRMQPDGANQQQVSFGEQNDWFPHFSPDGQQMVFLSFEKDVTGHPPNKDVTLRLMSMSDGSVKVLARLFGGQGTINVPSWSPDGKQFAFVSYVLIDPPDAPGK
jgi:hypothetical protein